MKPLIVVTTTPPEWFPGRERLVERLRAALAVESRVPYMFVEGTCRDDHVPNYTRAIRLAIERAKEVDATHITLLPDDAILAPYFTQVLSELVEQRPDDHLCLLSNHPKAKAAYADGAPGYWTIGGSILFGGTMRVEDWGAYLDWRELAIEPEAYVSFDDGVNLWHVLAGKRCFKPLPSLCQHDTSLESNLGNAWQDSDPAAMVLRKAQVFEPAADLRGRDWTGNPPDVDPECAGAPVVADLGRTFRNLHWDIVRKLRPQFWDIERMYAAHRNGMPVSRKPSVMVVVPLFGEPAMVLARTEPTRDAVVDDLASHGIDVVSLRTPGDSLVQRMRQRVMHEFLKSTCTHLLWWDADIECLTPDAVRKMLATGHDVVAGAYPFKDDTDRVVCNIRREDFESGQLRIENGCLEVQDAGTGFMLVSRKVHVQLAVAHPELIHFSLGDSDRGEPLWAIYDTAIYDGQLLSEDYQLCRLWQREGGKVYIYVPAKFRHWGLYGYTGSLEKQYGLVAQDLSLDNPLLKQGDGNA